MPPINSYMCNHCDFQMPSGWGQYTYAIDSRGDRVVCPHPGEFRAAEGITGLSWQKAEEQGLIGISNYCVCPDCLTQYEIDLEKDELLCGTCGSTNIVSEMDLVGKKCPSCKIGDFVEIVTGVRS